MMTDEKMAARQWLGRARYIDREIQSLERALQDARDQATRITQNYQSDGAQNTKDPHKLDKLGEYADMIREKRENLIAVKQEITGAIYELESGRSRSVLMDYYVNGMTWEEVAAKNHYSWRSTMYARKEALREIESLHRFAH